MGEQEPTVTRLSHRVVDPGDGNVVVLLDGELDMATSEQLRAALSDVIPSVSGTLVLDTEQLRFADSSALALWVSWSKQVPRLEIHKPRPMVRRVIEAMGLTAILNPQ